MPCNTNNRAAPISESGQNAVEGMEPDLKALTYAITECRQLAKSARRQIEVLVNRNLGLQAELAELTQKESQARHLAYHDGLTGLPNRTLLHDRFHQAMFLAERHHKSMALLMLDLDGFKGVNDQLGHASGDKVLQAVAQRLSKSIRGADTACRYGGDEFLVMLPEINNPNSADTLAAEIRRRLGEPYIIDGHQIHMAVSIGVAIYPDNGRTFDDLMKRADSAMYRAKGTGHATSIIELSGKEHDDPSSDAMESAAIYASDLFFQDAARAAEKHNEYHPI